MQANVVHLHLWQRNLDKKIRMQIFIFSQTLLRVIYYFVVDLNYLHNLKISREMNDKKVITARKSKRVRPRDIQSTSKNTWLVEHWHRRWRRLQLYMII